jgi:acetolactate synthase-1/2/3 large subunit
MFNFGNYMVNATLLLAFSGKSISGVFYPEEALSQRIFFKRKPGIAPAITDISGPDFVKLAGAYDIPAQRVEDRKDLKEAINKMLDHNGPYLLEVKVEKEENVFPMVPSGGSVSDMILELPGK